MWSKISSALKSRDGNDGDTDHSEAAQSTARCPPPDPFCANATTYYTQQMPPSPPRGSHSRTASREEDTIWSLRTQLALQQELCTQFEIDLGARDELVKALTIRLEASEKENDKRKSVLHSWKKKAADLEKMCRHLEEEVESSRQESMERSVMDEASGEALRQLHRQISQLERDKGNVEAERDSLARTVDNLRDELDASSKTSKEASHHLHGQVSQLQQEKSDIEAERDNLSSEISRLRVHIQQLQKDSAVMEVMVVQLNKQVDQYKEDIGGLNIALESKQQELELVKRKHGARPTASRTSVGSSAAGKTATSAGPPSNKTSAASTRSSSPISSRASTLGTTANTRPSVANAMRAVSTSSMESKARVTSRRVSIMSMPSEADEKENATASAPSRNPRRPLVPA